LEPKRASPTAYEPKEFISILDNLVGTANDVEVVLV
jgi:hypothetical protein